MALQLPDARTPGDEVLEAFRLRALRAIELGRSERDVAEPLGLACETVSRRWTAYGRGGLDALPRRRTGRPDGTGRLLTPEQEERVRAAIDGRRPHQVDIGSPLWTRHAVGDLIRREFGVDLEDRTVGNHLKRRGYVPRRPARRARGQDPAEVGAWPEETYPEVVDLANEDNADIWFLDEAGLDPDEYRGRGYAGPGKAPEVGVSGNRRRVNVITAMTAGGRLEFMTYTRTLNSALLPEFRGRCCRRPLRRTGHLDIEYRG